MTFHDRLARLLTLHEGLRLKPYKDTVGKLTIGIGRNLDDRGITVPEAHVLFSNDIEIVSADLRRHLPWWVRLDPVRQAVLADMCFNLGWPRLSQFKATLAHVRAGDYEQAAEHMTRSLWYRQVKTRGVRLVRMMRTGEWPTEIER